MVSGFIFSLMLGQLHPLYTCWTNVLSWEACSVYSSKAMWMAVSTWRLRMNACVLTYFSCVRLFWDPKDSSLPGSSRILQARILEWVAMPSFGGLSHLEWMLLLLLSHFSCVQLYATPKTAAHQAPLSLGFSRQEHWSGLPFPSPMHENEKWKWSRSVVSDS